jgi:GntR family transcriptional regulator
VSNLDRLGKLSRDDSSPLYLQLQKTLRDAIHSSVFVAEDAIPAERDLAEGFDVSRITVRKAIDGLIEEGLLTRRRGAGTFVTTRFEKSISKISSFSEDMISRGRTPRSAWLSKVEGTVNPEEALALGLSPGATVYRYNRIRFADNATMALEYAAIPSFCLSGLEAVDTSIYEALDRSGYRPVRALQRLRAISFSREHADLLGIEAGDPCLFIERRGLMADGRAVEFTRSYYRGDAYDLVAELNQQ